jgi:hypothetical protein
MDLIENQRVVHIRSLDSNSYTNGTWSFILPEAISVNQDEEIRVSVINASIPYSFYNVNYANKYLDVRESDANGSNAVNYTLTLTEGNYNAIQFLSLFQSAINSRSASVGKSFTYVITYDKFTNKGTFSLSSLNAKSVFLFSSGSNQRFDCEYLLGFSGGDKTLTSSSPLTSNATINMSPYEAIYINSNLGIVNNYYTKTSNLSPILLKVPITSLPFSYIQWENRSGDLLTYRSSRQVISTIEIQIKDADGDDIDLQNGTWFLSLKFHSYPRPRNFTVQRPDEMIPVISK